MMIHKSFAMRHLNLLALGFFEVATRLKGIKKSEVKRCGGDQLLSIDQCLCTYAGRHAENPYIHA